MEMRELSCHAKLQSSDLHVIKQAGIHLLKFEEKLRGMHNSSDYDDLLIFTQAILQRTSSIFHRLINESRPISRLPPEILLTVFSYVPDWVPAIRIQNWKEGLHWSFAAPRTDQLRNLTAVCSQWRKLALGDSTLWSTFWESNSKFATSSSLHISRCPAGPLNVFTKSKNTTRMIELVREHAPRIRQLHCFGSSDDRGGSPSPLVLTLLETLKTVDFGLLQHLSLPVIPKFILDEPSALLLVTPITAATLRSLRLSSWSLPSQSFPSLTRFVFWHPTHNGSPQLETHSLLRFLAGVPNLEVFHLLRLRIQSGAHEQESAEVAREVELCHLRYLTYDSESEEVDIPSLTHLLSHMRIPAHCCIRVDRIQVSQYAPCNDMHTLMMQLLGRRSRRRLTLCLLCSKLYSFTDAVLEIQPETENAGEVTGVTHIQIRFDYRDAASEQPLDAFLSLSLEQVEELRISSRGSEDASSGIIACILPKLVNVRNLAISLQEWSAFAEDYLGPLRDMLDPLRASSERPPACPGLEALDMYVPISADPIMEVIGQTLASRAEAGFPVRRLAIYAFRFAHTTESSPRRHVTHFDASRSINRLGLMWDKWPLLKSSENTVRSSQTVKYDPIGTGWSTLVE